MDWTPKELNVPPGPSACNLTLRCRNLTVKTSVSTRLGPRLELNRGDLFPSQGFRFLSRRRLKFQSTAGVKI